MQEKSQKEINNLIAEILPFLEGDSGFTYRIDVIIKIEVLKAYFDSKIQRHHIIKALHSIKESASQDSETFQRNLDQCLKEEKKEDSKTFWRIILPVNVKLAKRKIHLNGFEFTSLSGKNLKYFPRGEYSINERGGDFYSMKRPVTNRMLVVNVQGRNHYSAWYNLDYTFSLLRGIVDFAFSKGVWDAFVQNRSRTNIKHPKYIFGIHKDSKRYIEFITEDLPDRKPIVNDVRRRLFNKLTTILANKPHKGSINELLSNCLVLYSEAMSAIDEAYCFLSFWQILEGITLSQPGESKVVKRLNYFVEEVFKHSLTEYIQSLADKRNDFVHRGIRRIDTNNILLTKEICDLAMNWLISNIKALPTQNHLESFYSLKDSNSKELNTKLEVIQLVKNSRSFKE